MQILLFLNNRSIAYFSNCVGWEIGLFCRSHKKIDPSFNVSKYQNSNAFPDLLGLETADLYIAGLYIQVYCFLFWY